MRLCWIRSPPRTSTRGSAQHVQGPAGHVTSTLTPGSGFSIFSAVIRVRKDANRVILPTLVPGALGQSKGQPDMKGYPPSSRDETWTR
eukprot:753681-Hanusia_phi.AAC.9